MLGRPSLAEDQQPCVPRGDAINDVQAEASRATDAWPAAAPPQQHAATSAAAAAAAAACTPLPLPPPPPPP
eukprot:6457998-Prymnesium_polylepis.1